MRQGGVSCCHVLDDAGRCGFQSGARSLNPWGACGCVLSSTGTPASQAAERYARSSSRKLSGAAASMTAGASPGKSTTATSGRSHQRTSADAASLGEPTGSHTRIVDGPRFAQCAYAVRSASAHSSRVLARVDP